MQNMGYYGVQGHSRSSRYNRPENLSNSVKKKQNMGYYGVQGHSRSLRSVSIESPYAISYQWSIVTDILSRTVSEFSAYCSNLAPMRSLWLKISGTRGRLPPIIFAWIVRPMNALELCPWQFSHRCYGWGATSENRSKIGDFTPTRSLIQNFRYKGSPPTNNFCTVS